jgi:hypothetical protein
LANTEELAGKAAVHAVMLMKQEALNIVFGGAASVPPPYSIGGALSTSSVTLTPSRCPSLEPNKPLARAPALGAHCRTGAALSRFGDLHTTSLGSIGPAIDLNRTLQIGDTTPTGARKHHHISTSHAKGSQPVGQYARAGWGAHRGGNGSYHLSIVIAGRLQCQPKAIHGRRTCMI